MLGFDKNKKINSIDKSQVIHGTLNKHRNGFGFVECQQFDKDVFIPVKGISGAMNGDEVVVELAPEYMWKQSPEGKIVKVTSRNTKEVAGTLYKSGNYGFIVPEGKKFTEDVFVKKSDMSGAKDGDKVVAKITKYPDRFNSAEGKVTEIIARAGEAGGDIKVIARGYGMRETFPSRVSAEARAVSKEEITPEEIARRKDLRDEIIFTIDGADSKDFDDAVSIGKLPNGNYLLGVHIADVAHYVKEDSHLDEEAYKRGTSVYLLNQVIPMLPKALSNDICSLRPGRDRLTLSVDMEIDSNGEVVAHEVYESVINSKARLVYDDVSDLLEGIDKGYHDKSATITGDYQLIVNSLFLMQELAEILAARRDERGSLDFDLDEARISLNSDGIPVEIEIADRRCANKLIEEFMLLANETIAEHFYWLGIPFVYRIHEKPEYDKVEKLKRFLTGFGINIKSGSTSIHPKSLNDMLSRVKDSSYENVISTVTLRSMQKAYYGTSCDGHFGLALKYYTHFTSPIRRYPDLMIHRIIKDIIANGPTQKLEKHYKKIVVEAAEQSSKTEREAVEVEREVEKMKKAEYMSYHIGEQHNGIISGMTNYGMFVQLENTIEGMVHVDEMYDDYYDYYPEKYAMVGRLSGNEYKLGNLVMIMVESVDIDRKEINFVLM